MRSRDLIVVFLVIQVATRGSTGEDAGVDSARLRNQIVAASALPGQRNAILAVTRWGANVVVNDAGQVEAVQLEGCIFPDSVLQTLHDLPQLKQLKIGHSKVTDDGLRFLSGLHGLESLTMTQSNIGDDGLAHLADLQGLKSLTLHMSLVTDEGMRSLGKISTLEQLDLENTIVGDAGLAHLSKLSNLKKLLLSRTRVTDAGLVHLAGLVNLRELALYHNDISDVGLQHLRGLVNLKELDIEGTQISDAGIADLAGMTQLETLNVRYTDVTTRGLSQLRDLSQLQRIWLGSSHELQTLPRKQSQLWLGSAYGDDIFIYELGSFNLLRRLVVGPNPHGLSATADGRTVHVAVEHFDDPNGELIWVDTRTFEIRGRVEVGPQPQEHECTPDGKWIYVPCGDGHWYVVDGHTQQVVKKIATGGRPHNTVVSPDGKWVYLSPMGYPHAVTVVDIDAGHKIVGEIRFGDVTRPPAISGDGRYFYENIDNMLGFQVADIARREVVKTVEHTIPAARRYEWSRSHGLGVRPDQAEIWSCNVEHHTVHVHELMSGNYTEVAAVDVPGRAYWLSFSPDSKYCFVSVRSKRQVAVVDCETKNIVKMLDAGRAVKRSQVVEVSFE